MNFGLLSFLNNISAITISLAGLAFFAAGLFPSTSHSQDTGEPVATEEGDRQKRGRGKKGRGKRETETKEIFQQEMSVKAIPDDPEGIAFFEARVRPTLAKYCYECHSAKEGKSKGGLRVDTRIALLQGGDTGPAIVPGKLDDSLLITAIRYHEADFEMPPDGKMPDANVADLEQWVAMGAPDPRGDAVPVSVTSDIDVEAGREFWSYVPPRKPSLPTVRDSAWPRTGIDRFILSSLEKNQLSPASDALPETLVRRMFYVLCGLPPSPDDVTKWTREIGPQLDQAAIARLADTLLASPRFGERWGRHWLDVARYGDSTGGDSNNVFQHAWRYRDYVIDAFNADTPYDRFIREQLAGDLLPARSDEQKARNIVATGFLAIGQKLVGEVDERKFFADLVDEQIDATTRAFLATTAACARCHDHKSDPIPQSDYYSLAAIFRNTETRFGLIKAQARQHSTLIDVTGMGLPVAGDAVSDEEFARLEAERDAAAEKMDELMKRIRGGGEKVTRANLRRSRTQRDRTEAALQAYDPNGKPLTFVMGAAEREAALDTRLLVRGELDQPGPLVERGFLQVITPSTRRFGEGSGRLELAHWIAHSENPLTARVISNRIWHWMFGQGLVTSLDDFGATGSLPSHPELLDYLAMRMIENRWSMKKMIREIVLSRSWQQASTHHPKNFQHDPDNRFLWRGHSRRLEAEAIRDALLTVAGNLKVGRPDTPLLAPLGEGTVGQNVFEPDIRSIESNLRSVYLPRVRNVLPESLELFDAPDAGSVTGARNTTTVPLQALYSMNHPFVRQQAEAFARLVASLPKEEQIDYAYRKAFGREPTARERELAAQFSHQLADAGPNQVLVAWCHALLCTAEFIQID